MCEIRLHSIHVKLNLPTQDGIAVSIQLNHFLLLLYKE